MGLFKDNEIIINNLLLFCQCSWLILHSRKFNYSTRYIKCNENNVQTRKLNEPVGFLVSSLNKNEKQNKVGRTSIYMNSVASSTLNPVHSVG